MGRLKPEPFREIKRRLERAGFVEVSQKGSHVKFIRRTGAIVDTVIVPNKHEVPVGTFAQHSQSGTHHSRGVGQTGIADWAAFEPLTLKRSKNAVTGN